MRPLKLTLAVLACSIAPYLSAQVTEPSKPQPATPTHVVCPVNITTPTPGDNQLSSEDFRGAEAFFRSALASQSDSEAAHLGLVRALIGEDRVTEARQEAELMLKEDPKSATAEAAASEADFRAADVSGALTHARAAVQDDPCEAQGLYALADVSDLLSYYGTGARFLAQAHHLRPNDELIRRDWMSTLPRKERIAELTQYLDGPHDLSEERERSYQTALAHLQATHPGECRVTSKADSTRIALQPVYGDRSHPVAFGLDLQFNHTRRRMQIDTGASGIILTPSAAKALKLEPEYKLKASGIGDDGKVDSYLAHVASISLGDIEISDCMVEVLGKSRLNVDGLIGMNVFSGFLVTLNYPEAQLQLDPLPVRPPLTTTATKDSKPTLNDTGTSTGPRDRYTPPEFKDWSHIIRRAHQILLPSALKPASAQHFMIMDTGAGKTLLAPDMAKEAGKLHDSNLRITGISGEVKHVYESPDTELFVADLKLPPQSYYATDLTSLSHSNGFETSGLLGLPTLQRLTIRIDYRDNLLKLTYDPKHDFIHF